MARIQLPPPGVSDGFAALLLTRRSVREYTDGELTVPELARLLWAGQGVSHSSGKHTAPSPRGLNPLSFYLVAGRVANVDQGLYAYQPRADALESVGRGDLRADLCRAALEDQPWVKNCAALIAVTGDVRYTEAEFADQPPDGKRGRRYIYMEAGAAAQNIALQAAELRLGTVLVGGFDDAAVKQCLSVETEPLILMPIGRTFA